MLFDKMCYADNIAYQMTNAFLLFKMIYVFK